MPNALANETSPYLLQHKDNPVDWRPWGDEAIAFARREQKPIFLSIGYAACHWCHVMEHESFENQAIAAVLNERFIAIKVDREERPDLDQVYMAAVQALTGRGGWPMSVFLTPDLKPFYGGTYWPPTAQRGMPGFDQVLDAVHDAWTQRREQALATADQLTERVAAMTAASAEADEEPTREAIEAAVRHLERGFDPAHGGFGAAPKFPHATDLALLLRAHAASGREALLDMVRTTLDRMAAGGIYDHLGGGFARYSVDERWLVPHFEKMLYDNALLAGVYADAHAVTGEESYARVARETLDYLLRDMTGPDGAFYATEDADSAPHDDPAGHKEEGLFYTWTAEEVRVALGDDDADLFCRVYDVSPLGNFERRSIPWLPKPIATHAKLRGIHAADLERAMASARERLFAVRSKRPRPGLDDKVIAAWNGLAIEALARAGMRLAEPRYVAAASRAADTVLTLLRDAEGRLLHTRRAGVAKTRAFLDDYGALALGLVTLYEATWDERRIEQAALLVDEVLARFVDPADGGFFYTADDHERLVVRAKDTTDNAYPGGAGLVTTALVRLARLTGQDRYAAAAERALRAAGPWFSRAQGAMAQSLVALDDWLGPTRELVLVGSGPEAISAAADLRRAFTPRALLAGRLADGYRSPLLDPLFAGRASADGRPTLYVCQGQTCAAPVVGAAAIADSIDALGV